jgi:hypothetical protein
MNYNKNDEENYDLNNYSTFNKLIYSKYHYTKIITYINDLRTKRIYDYNQLSLTSDYVKNKDYTNFTLYAYYIYEFSNLIKVNKFDYKLNVIFPFIRIAIVTKLYYIYFIFRFINYKNYKSHS